jgi:Mlc titration factor MtfA (ptsG expression regulator)
MAPIIELLLIVLGMGLLCSGIFWRVESNKKSGRSNSSYKLSNNRGQELDRSLEKNRGKKISFKQRQIIRSNIGLYGWVPNELISPWEERIITFLESFPITFKRKDEATEEMKILVAAEAALLIVKRPMSDYRHLRVVHLWKDQIDGQGNALGTANRHEVNLSWQYLKMHIRKARDGHNLTLHEFAHLIDFADDGVAQSIPVAHGTSCFDEWKQVVDVEHERLMKAYESGKNYSIRAYGGYECIKGNKPELFSCGTSAFFERGARLKRESPEIYEIFKKFYGIDPASWRRK